MDVILVSYNYFWVIVSIWYIHVLQCYKFRPCNPNFQENTNINKNIIIFFSSKSFQNYYIGVTSLYQTWSDPCPQPRKCMVHALMSMKVTASCHTEVFLVGSCNSEKQHDLPVKFEMWLWGWNHYTLRGLDLIKIY